MGRPSRRLVNGNRGRLQHRRVSEGLQELAVSLRLVPPHRLDPAQNLPQPAELLVWRLSLQMESALCYESSNRSCLRTIYPLPIYFTVYSILGVFVFLTGLRKRVVLERWRVAWKQHQALEAGKRIWPKLISSSWLHPFQALSSGGPHVGLQCDGFRAVTRGFPPKHQGYSVTLVHKNF
ncbi:hypothetical protein EYF80_027142 [Liparis tanakae]|uniref:Uncharacterized protein n=1 Tax=Liparis tanakae TaxID=230148 RepID=A0A4Z2HCK0_9TELE|nr:hypothetical protein EYF80_027142 [Liparis tanakae]